MLGKNNAKVRYQQTAEKTTRFTFKKLSIGLVSAVACATLLSGNPVTVDAQDLATEQVTETTYYLQVDAPTIRISSAYTAISKAEAEAYFKQSVWENGERGLEWSFDESSSTFYASKSQGFVENPVQDPVVDEPVVEEPVVEEPAVQETTFTLIAENPTTNLTTEYSTADVQEAELYFRNYVNENGLGHLEWTYDSAAATFYASPAQQVEQPVEETPEVDEPGVEAPGTDEEPEEEATEYTARYELRDENWQLIETLQESVYRGWDSLEEGSIVVAESLVDNTVTSRLW